ncbi:MAG TPA: DMT family transporter [Burkholderiales bacterium]|nr:DMT family transporter [Burkholderiales bacterium]
MFTKQKLVPVSALLTGAIVWGLIWYPYRILQEAGIAGDIATFITYFLALLAGLLVYRGAFKEIGRASWIVLWIGLSAGWTNLAYVLAVIEGEVVRVLLLFYLAPLWTVILAGTLLEERINTYGLLVVILSLAGAVTMLWHLESGWPLPQNSAEWLGLSAGFMFAVSNVLARKAHGISLQLKALSIWAGVALFGLVVAAGTGHGLPSRLGGYDGLLLLLVALVIFLVNPVVQYGLSHVSANRAIVIFMFELVVGAVSAYVLADEAVSLQDTIGGAMIIAASLLSGRLELESQENPA